MDVKTPEKAKAPAIQDPILVAKAGQGDAERAHKNSEECYESELTIYNYRNHIYAARLKALTTISDIESVEEVAAAEVKVAAAKENVTAAKENVTAAKENVVAAAAKVAAAKEEVAAAISQSEAIITEFNDLIPQERSLTYAPPYGMLGRDEVFDSIINEMEHPSDKFPPITVISTSRAGKTLLLDTLVKKCNSDPSSGVYVVTCSLNVTRVTGSDFKVGHCTPSDVPRFVAFVLNVLLFGSIGHHSLPTDATADSLAWPAVLNPKTLCALLRKRFGLDSETNKAKKLLLAVDELTSFFDRFDSDSRKDIASSLGKLCTPTSRLLLTGFTNMADDAFLGVSKRFPVRFQLPSVNCSTRQNLIPQMTAMLWGVRQALRDPAPDTTHRFQFVYCVIHETLKSSPGLMGTVVERLARNSVPLNLNGVFTMWVVLRAVMKLLPDYKVYDDAEIRAGAFNALDAFLLAKDQEAALPELMRVNMAAPGRLDAFRVIMAVMAERRAATPSVSTSIEKNANAKELSGLAHLPPTVQVLFRFMDAYNLLYTNWLNNRTDFRFVKGDFFEIACRYGIELLWHRIGAGLENLGWGSATDIHRRVDTDVFVCQSFVKCFPVSKKGNPMEVDTKMFAPNTLLYPTVPEAKDATAPTKDATAPTEDATAPTEDATAPTEDATAPTEDATAPTEDATAPTEDATAPTEDATAKKHEVNPLLDLVLNLPATKAGVEGIVHIWVQAKHTKHCKPFKKGVLDAAMEVVENYNKKVPERPVLEVLFLVVGPSQLCSKITGLVRGDVELWMKNPVWKCTDYSVPLSVVMVTSETERERLLGPFISQLVPDFDSHDEALEVKLEEKCRTMRALQKFSEDKPFSDALAYEKLQNEENAFLDTVGDMNWISKTNIKPSW